MKLTNFTDSKNATHHWYPFLKYEEECKAAGKEASVNDWMRASGQLQNKIDFEETKKAAEAEASRLERELENTTLAKFIRNVESRIYATLSKQMVDAMFADCGDSCANSGTADVEGAVISWVKDTDTGAITLIVDGPDGYTEITIPGAGEFNF